MIRDQFEASMQNEIQYITLLHDMHILYLMIVNNSYVISEILAFKHCASESVIRYIILKMIESN